MSETLTNIPYEELIVGQSASLTRTVTADDVKIFAASSHDTNPAHLDPEYAAGTQFKEVIMHGMFSAGMISAAIGTRLPGLGTIYLGQDLQFRRPVHIGDTLTATITVLEKNDAKKWVTLETIVTNQNGDKVVVGKANVLAPAEKISRPAIAVPTVTVNA